MDPVRSPYLTTVCDTPAVASQFNADSQHHENVGSASAVHSTSPAVNVSLSDNTRAVGSTARQHQSQLGPLSSSVIDEQCQLAQYPLADLSPVLAEQTLVSAQTPLAEATQLTQYPLSETLHSEAAQLSQYPLSDSSSNASVHVGEMSSLPQFLLGDSLNDVGTTLQREVDAAAAVVVQTDDTGPAVEESDVLRSDREQHQSSPSLSAGDAMPAEQRLGLTFDNADAGVISCSNQPADQQQKSDDDNDDDDSHVLVGTSKSSFVSRSLCPTNSTGAINKTVDSLDEMVESESKCLASRTSFLVPSCVKSDGVDTLIDQTDVGSAVPITSSAPLDGAESDILAGSSAVKILCNITDLQAVSLSTTARSLRPAGYIAQPSDGNRLPDSGWASSSSSAVVEQACSSQLDVFSEACKTSDVATAVGGSGGRDLGTLVHHSVAITADDAVRKVVGIPTDERTSNQVKLLPLDDDANSLRNAADGSEVSDVLSSAVPASANISHMAAAQNSEPVSQRACHDIVTGSDDDRVSSRSVVTELNRTVTHAGSSMTVHHQPHDSVTSDNELLSAGTHPQNLTTEPQDPLDTVHLSLPSEQDSGSEFDEDRLGEDVKMILAKYRIRRGPVGSDSTPVATTDDVLTPAADDSLPLSSQKIAKDFDGGSCSDSSDDTLAVRVKALLIREQQQSSSAKMLPATICGEMSQSTAKVQSVHSSSQSTSVDYSSLSRELDEIQMNLDSMRNSETNSSRSSTYSTPTDTSLTQEALGVNVQRQKTSVDHLLQHGSVEASDADCLPVDYSRFVSDAGAAMSDLKQVEAVMQRSRSAHLRQVSPTSVSSAGRGTEPLATMAAELDRGCGWDSTLFINADLSETRTDAKTVQRPVQPSMTLSIGLTSASDVKFADSRTSLPGLSLPKSVNSLMSRNEWMSAADGDTMSSTGSVNLGHKWDDRRSVNVSDSSLAVHDTVSGASSPQTDIARQSDSTGYAHSDDLRSARDQSRTVQAAVKELELSLSNLIQTHRNDASSASNAYSYLHKEKQSSVNAAMELPALSDDECRLSERGLSHSFTDSSCGLSPVPNRDPFNIVRSDQNIAQQSSSQYFDRNVQQTESFAPHNIEREKQNGCEIPNESMSYIDTARLPHILKSRSVGSSDQSVISDARFVSSAHLELTPLAELPPGRDSSLDGDSYDGDNEQALTDRQSYVGNSELRSYNVEAGHQPLSASQSAGSYDVDVIAVCLNAAKSSTISQSPSDLHLLQPYQ